MNELSPQGEQKLIDFIGRWAMAFFALLVVLAGWLGGRYEAGEFGILFVLGFACAGIAAVLCVGLTWFALRLIERQR